MTSLVDIFERLIENAWKLERDGSNWIIRERHNKTRNPELRITGKKALVFSLDQSPRDPWPFMAQSIKGMRSVCDAILVTCFEDAAYVIAVEMKSKNTEKASEQIASTWHFMEWLRGLLKLHGHWNQEWTFCGLISSVRHHEQKGTSHRESGIVISRSKNYGYLVAHIRNQRRINLNDLHRKLAEHG